MNISTELQKKAAAVYPAIGDLVNLLLAYTGQGNDPHDLLGGKRSSKISIFLRNQKIRESAKLIPDDLVALRARNKQGRMIQARAGIWKKEFNNFLENTLITHKLKGKPENDMEARRIIYYELQVCWGTRIPTTSKQIARIIERDYINPTQ